ncbi:MAG: hypothetical protein QE263_03530 [Vampirovibrionales bacterium]|nr:hypothetical protein [Vampirovibrionales bacterium]
MTTIASGATPYFGNKTQSDKAKRSPFFYRQTQGKVNLNRFERGKAYIGSSEHLKAGFNEAQQWLKGKSVIGKVIAIGMLASTAALEFVISPLTIGIWSLGKIFFPSLNLSGLGRAFHYGVQKSYELSKTAK